MSGRARSPNLAVLLSSLGACAALGLCLWLTRASGRDAWQSEATLTVTPERAAESFIEAYRRHAYLRAASFATGSLARDVRARAKQVQASPSPADARRYLLQESHWLRHERLRLVGVLVETGQDEANGEAIALTLVRKGDRYFVEDVEWPNRADDPP